MSSDNKALRVFQKACIKPGFEEEIVRLRSKYNVPRTGFASRKDIDKWDQKRNEEYIDTEMRRSRAYRTPPKGFSGTKSAWIEILGFDQKPVKRIFTEYDRDLSDLLDAYKLSPTLFPLLSDYLASGQIEYGDLPFYGCKIDPSEGPFQRKSEDRFRSHGKKFVKLVISEDAELPDVKKYIESHWKYISILIGAHGRKKPRIKSSANWDRDLRVFTLSRRSKKDLAAEARLLNPDFARGTKEMMIGKLMPEYGFSELTRDAVAKIIERQLKARKSDT